MSGMPVPLASFCSNTPAPALRWRYAYLVDLDIERGAEGARRGIAAILAL